MCICICICTCICKCKCICTCICKCICTCICKCKCKCICICICICICHMILWYIGRSGRGAWTKIWTWTEVLSRQLYEAHNSITGFWKVDKEVEHCMAPAFNLTKLGWLQASPSIVAPCAIQKYRSCQLASPACANSNFRWLREFQIWFATEILWVDSADKTRFLKPQCLEATFWPAGQRTFKSLGFALRQKQAEFDARRLTPFGVAETLLQPCHLTYLQRSSKQIRIPEGDTLPLHGHAQVPWRYHRDGVGR